MDLTPPTLQSDRVRLEPLTQAHLPALCKVGFDPIIWRWFNIAPITTTDAMQGFIDRALSEQQRQISIPFVTIDAATNTVVGSTRFMCINIPDRGVEIGATWIAPAWQRTHINTHAKLLMLTHAFDHMKAIRVELKTDELNAQSRAAILRLGAIEEGTLRNLKITHSGRYRNTVFFSILDNEWPAVRERLQAKLRAAST